MRQRKSTAPTHVAFSGGNVLQFSAALWTVTHTLLALCHVSRCEGTKNTFWFSSRLLEQRRLRTFSCVDVSLLPMLGGHELGDEVGQPSFFSRVLCFVSFLVG